MDYIFRFIFEINGDKSKSEIENNPFFLQDEAFAQILFLLYKNYDNLIRMKLLNQIHLIFSLEYQTQLSLKNMIVFCQNSSF